MNTLIYGTALRWLGQKQWTFCFMYETFYGTLWEQHSNWYAYEWYIGGLQRNVSNFCRLALDYLLYQNAKSSWGYLLSREHWREYKVFCFIWYVCYSNDKTFFSSSSSPRIWPFPCIHSPPSKTALAELGIDKNIHRSIFIHVHSLLTPLSLTPSSRRCYFRRLPP